MKPSMWWRIKTGARQRAGGFISGRRNARLFRFGARCAYLYLDLYQNKNWDSATNGEKWLLERLGAFAPSCVFDVGANEGEWTRLARAAFPSATVYAFELIPSTFARLAQNLEGVDGVVLNNFGLSNEDGTVQAKSYLGDSGISSLLDYPHPWPSSWTEAQVRRGDEVARDLHINILKIDTEGAEPMVLAGFEQTLAGGKVDVIQFEYGGGWLLSGGTLKDACATLERHNFAVGKLYPNHVAFKDYELTDEDFRGFNNYVAVTRSRPDIIAALK
jgi:FkbM family methyltransferase